MRFLLLYIFFSSLYVNKGYSQVDSLWTIEDLSNITVYLYQQNQDNSASAGSATIIRHKNRYFILTAEHVAKEMTSSSQIVFRLDGDIPISIDFGSTTKSSELNWITHKEADISIIEIFPINNALDHRLKNWSLPSELIYAGKKTLSRDNDVTMIGYPLISLDIEHFSPITLTSYLSSGLITNYRYDTRKKCTFFYLDKPSMQGSSGGGVYGSVKKAEFYSLGKTILFGVIHGTAGDNTGGKLAAITPSFYVWDLLSQLN